jgi:hypothetical protein
MENLFETSPRCEIVVFVNNDIENVEILFE